MITPALITPALMRQALSDRSSAKELAHALIHSELTLEAQIAVLKELPLSKATAPLILGFREVLLAAAKQDPELIQGHPIRIDVCGTGGDGKASFNISTAAAFLLCTDIPEQAVVLKHGNRGFSSPVGSSQVLEALGVPLHDNYQEIASQLKRQPLAFLHAPFFHPAIATIAAARKAYGKATIFNAIGPLLNPLKPTHQLIGLGSPALYQTYKDLQPALKEQGCDTILVHSRDGFDEVSLTDDMLVSYNGDETVLTPQDFGAAPLSPEALHGAQTAQEAAQLLESVLSGTAPEAHLSAVAANAALAKSLLDKKTLQDLYQELLKKLQSGSVLKTLIKLREVSEPQGITC